MGIPSSPLSAPPADTRDAPAAIERQIEFERINTLYLIAQPMLVGGIAFSLLIGLLLAPCVDQTLLIGWVTLKVLILSARLVDGRLFQRDRHRSMRLSADPGRISISSTLAHPSAVIPRSAKWPS